MLSIGLFGPAAYTRKGFMESRELYVNVIAQIASTACLAPAKSMWLSFMSFAKKKRHVHTHTRTHAASDTQYFLRTPFSGC